MTKANPTPAPLRSVPTGSSVPTFAFLGGRAAVETKAAAEKTATMDKARSLLNDAHDMIEGGGRETSKAMSLIEDAGRLLYQGVIAGAVSTEEVTGAIGDIFGWKAKGKDADKTVPVKGSGDNASKTPFGTGEHLRKRINRAIDANDYVRGARETTFFSALPKDEVETVLSTLNDNGSLWTAYDTLQKLSGSVKVATLPFVRNPARIASFVNDMSNDEGLAQAWIDNPALQDAYTGMLRMLAVIDEQANEINGDAANVAIAA